MNKKREMTAEEICQEYLKEIARTLGEDRGNASKVWYSHGWFYLKIASRYQDGSVGCHHEAYPLRKSVLLDRIENLKKRPDHKG